MLKIKVASQNPIKIMAVQEIAKNYDFIKNSEIEGVAVKSEVSEQPLTLDETISGAINRARNAFVDCQYSIGLESGLMAVPHTKTGHMDMCVCAIYDGREFYLGISSAWECPEIIAKYIINDKLDMNQAFFKAGLTKSLKVGQEEGAIGILTKGRLNRKEYTKQALVNALIHLDNK